tara:strand:+ start:394 stop:579 length:186 start_codon:yes stop_codon:yes gene_type:complete
MKPGLMTTEFWLAIIAMIAASVLLGMDKIGPDIWAGVIAGVSGLYGVARGIAKVGDPNKRA